MTKEIERRIPALGGQAAEGDPIVHLKLFDPCGRWTYYATEYDPEQRMLYGYCISAFGGDYDEWGYASLYEIEAVRNRFGLGIERDLWFKPCHISELHRKAVA
ncbi:MAG: DUF2958 domain-containing protein [Actinomycetota bacterium]